MEGEDEEILSISDAPDASMKLDETTDDERDDQEEDEDEVHFRLSPTVMPPVPPTTLEQEEGPLGP